MARCRCVTGAQNSFMLNLSCIYSPDGIMAPSPGRNYNCKTIVETYRNIIVHDWIIAKQQLVRLARKSAASYYLAQSAFVPQLGKHSYSSGAHFGSRKFDLPLSATMMTCVR